MLRAGRRHRGRAGDRRRQPDAGLACAGAYRACRCRGSGRGSARSATIATRCCAAISTAPTTSSPRTIEAPAPATPRRDHPGRQRRRRPLAVRSAARRLSRHGAGAGRQAADRMARRPHDRRRRHARAGRHTRSGQRRRIAACSSAEGRPTSRIRASSSAPPPVAGIPTCGPTPSSFPHQPRPAHPMSQRRRQGPWNLERPSYVTVESVTFGYGDRPILAELDLVFRRGDVVGLMGGSGSGKTTVLRLISAQVRPDRGRVSSTAQDVNTPRSRRALCAAQADGDAVPVRRAVHRPLGVSRTSPSRCASTPTCPSRLSATWC